MADEQRERQHGAGAEGDGKGTGTGTGGTGPGGGPAGTPERAGRAGRTSRTKEPREPREPKEPVRAGKPGRSDEAEKARERAGAGAAAGPAQSAKPERPENPPAAEQSPPPAHEYRAAELAKKAGITTRTLRFYRERKLLPPPRREGRIAWYTEHHLARLHTITGLLSRGHTLGGIADLLAAFETGRDSRDAAELLGLESSLTGPFSEETPVRLTPEDLADYFQGEVTAENLAASLDIGYVAVDGDEFIHVSRRLLDASAELVRSGVPLAAVLAAGRELRRQTEAISEVFADIFRNHLLPKELSDAPDAVDAAHINARLERLSPIAKQIVDAELSMALDRRVQAEMEDWLRSNQHRQQSQDQHGTPQNGTDPNGTG